MIWLKASRPYTGAAEGQAPRRNTGQSEPNQNRNRNRNGNRNWNLNWNWNWNRTCLCCAMHGRVGSPNIQEPKHLNRNPCHAILQPNRIRNHRPVADKRRKPPLENQNPTNLFPGGKPHKSLYETPHRPILPEFVHASTPSSLWLDAVNVKKVLDSVDCCKTFNGIL